MNFNKRPLIGIAGVKNSGKDTVASMICLIQNRGTYSTFKHWNEHGDEYVKSVIHFADAMKDAISNIFHINRTLLDDRAVKDMMYYNPATQEIINEHNVIKGKISRYSYEELRDLGMPNNECAIKVRHLLQWFGTDICRNHINENIWVRTCMNRAQHLKNYNGYCIIADVRFQNEVDAILKAGGIVFRVNRNDASAKDNHASENINALTDCIDINNNFGLMGLYYNIYDKVMKLIK